MITKLTWSAILSIVMIPLLAIGFVDPLEGLPLLVIGLALGVTVRLLSRMRFPRFTWITVVVAAVFTVALLVFASLNWAAMMAEQAPGDTVMNPLNNGPLIGDVPVLILFMWVQRLVILVMVAGLVMYTVKIFRARKTAKLAQVSPPPSTENS